MERKEGERREGGENRNNLEFLNPYALQEKSTVQHVSQKGINELYSIQDCCGQNKKGGGILYIWKLYKNKGGLSI